MGAASGRTSDLDFLRASRAVELGWATEAEVEAARHAEDAAPGSGLLARLALSDAQRGALRAPPFPPEVAAALRDPGRVAGRFVLLERLGRGGMGDVWRAWDLDLARPVALKVLRRLDDPRARALLAREARVLAALKLPGIPAIYQVGEHGGAPHIAMELIEGETLAGGPRGSTRGARPRSRATPPAPSTRPTRQACCTGTSSPGTSCWTGRGASSSRTSGSPRRSLPPMARRARPSPGSGPSSARPSTCRPSRRAAGPGRRSPWTGGATSTRSGPASSSG